LIPAFVERIAAGEDPALAAQLDFDVLCACAAADRAAATGNPVDVTYV
jgi:hypothetical protein